jgi:hypothetical protein
LQIGPGHGRLTRFAVTAPSPLFHLLLLGRIGPQAGPSAADRQVRSAGISAPDWQLGCAVTPPTFAVWPALSRSRSHGCRRTSVKTRGVSATDLFSSLAGDLPADAVRTLAAKPTRAFEIVELMFRLATIADPAEIMERAKHWDATRAAVVGSPDNQKHALAHHHTIFGTLALDPLAVVGLNALGPQALVWLAQTATRVGSKPIPHLVRDLFEDDDIRMVCRLTGGLLGWRHLRATVEAERLEFEQSAAANSGAWRSRAISPRQYWILRALKDAALGLDPEAEWVMPRNRGEAYDTIKLHVENVYGNLGDDRDLAKIIRTCIDLINETHR